MSSDPFTARRQAFLQRLQPRSVAVIGGARMTHRNSDVEHRFRQSSDLLYLTGFPEPDALAVLAPGREQRFTLFVRPRDPERETWTGRRAGVDGAKARYGADAAFPIESLATELPKLLDGAEEVLYPTGEDRQLDEIILKAVSDLRAGERRGMKAPSRLSDLRTTLHEQRLVKDAEGLATLRRAAEVTAEAHIAA